MQCREFLARTLDDPFEIRKKVDVHGNSARLKGLDCLLAGGDQDRQQGLLSAVGPGFDPCKVPPLRLERNAFQGEPGAVRRVWGNTALGLRQRVNGLSPAPHRRSTHTTLRPA